MKPFPCIICQHNEWQTKFALAKDYEYGLGPSDYQIVSCAHCGVLRLEPMPGSDVLKDYYPPVYANFFEEEATLPRRILTGLYTRRLIKYLSGLLDRAEADILDVGCASGHLMAAMERKNPGWRTTGVEISATAVAEGRKKGREILEGSIEELPLPEASFDLILLQHLIEHVVNPEALARKLAVALKPGGRIVIETPNTQCLDLKLFKKYWGGLHYPRHTYLFSRDNLKLLLAKVGLKTESARTVMQPFGWALSVQNYLVDRFGLSTQMGRIRGYPLMMLASIPVVGCQMLMGGGSAMRVVASKTS